MLIYLVEMNENIIVSVNIFCCWFLSSDIVCYGLFFNMGSLVKLWMICVVVLVCIVVIDKWENNFYV